MAALESSVLEVGSFQELWSGRSSASGSMTTYFGLFQENVQCRRTCECDARRRALGKNRPAVTDPFASAWTIPLEIRDRTLPTVQPLVIAQENLVN